MHWIVGLVPVRPPGRTVGRRLRHLRHRRWGGYETHGPNVGPGIAEKDSGAAPVVMDQNRLHESPHDVDSATAAGRLVRGSPPHAVIHDLDADASGLGPIGRLDSAIRVRRRVGVIDTVAGGFVHREHHVVLGVPGKDKRRQPATNLGPHRRELTGMRWPDLADKLGWFASSNDGGWFAHVFPRLLLDPVHSRTAPPGQRRPPTGGRSRRQTTPHAAGTASGTPLVDAWPERPEIVDAPDNPVVGLLLAATELGVALVGLRRR
jgi:hypothetical protein